MDSLDKNNINNYIWLSDYVEFGEYNHDITFP
jgi:hypothetical protein